MRKAILCAFLLMASRAHGDVPLPTKVEDVLRVLKAKPRAMPEDLAVAGSGVEGALVQILVNRDMDREIRVRAAWALGGYPGNRARAVLVTIMSDLGEDEAVRASAMVGYARVEGERAIVDLKPYLKNERPALRIGAAKALGVIGGPMARTLLESAIEHEEVLEVRLAMEEALRGMK